MVYVGLEPLAFRREIIGLESSKIASHLRVKTGLALQGGNHGCRRIKVFLHLVEFIHGIHLHAAHGIADLLSGDIHDTHIVRVTR